MGLRFSSLLLNCLMVLSPFCFQAKAQNSVAAQNFSYSIRSQQKLPPSKKKVKPDAQAYAQAARELQACNLGQKDEAAELYGSRLKSIAGPSCALPSGQVADLQSLVTAFDSKQLNQGAMPDATRVTLRADAIGFKQRQAALAPKLKARREALRDLSFSFDEKIRAMTLAVLVKQNHFERRTQGKESAVAAKLNSKMNSLNELCQRLQKKKENSKTEQILQTAFQGILGDPDFQILMASDTFQKSAGLEHIAQGTAMQTCQKNGIAFFRGGRKDLGILYVDQEKDLLTADAVREATAEVKAATQSQLHEQNKVQANLLSGKHLALSDGEAIREMTEVLSQKIAINPVVFSEILKNEPSLSLAHEICTLTKKAVAGDRKREELNNLIMIAGVLSFPASFVLPGAGAALLSLGMFATFDIGVNLSNLQEDQTRLEGYRAANATDLIAFSDGFAGAKKASDSVDLTSLSLVLAAGGAFHDLQGLSQSLANHLAQTHHYFSPKEVTELNQMLKQHQTDESIANFFNRTDRANALPPPRNIALVETKNYNYFYRDLLPEQKAAFKQLQQEVGFAKMSPSAQAEFINQAGKTHFTGKVLLSREGLSQAQFDVYSKKGIDELRNLAKSGKIKLKPDRDKSQALLEFKRYLEKNPQVKDAFASVDLLANQKMLVLGDLASEHESLAKIAAQKTLVEPNYAGLNPEDHYLKELSSIKLSTPEGKGQVAQIKSEIENQLEYWNAHSTRLRNASASSLDAGDFTFDGKVYSGAAKKQLREDLEKQLQLARRKKQSLDQAYARAGGGKYTPAKVSSETVVTSSPLREPEIKKTVAGRAEVDALAKDAREFEDSFQSLQQKATNEILPLSTAKEQLTKMKSRVLPALHFDRSPALKTDAEIIHAQIERSWAKTEASIEQSLQENKAAIHRLTKRIEKVSEYAPQEFGHHGPIEQRVENIIRNAKDPTERREDLSALKKELEGDLKALSAVHAEDERTLFSNYSLAQLKERVRANIQYIEKLP